MKEKKKNLPQGRKGRKEEKKVSRGDAENAEKKRRKESKGLIGNSVINCFNQLY
jgi:hypothetical protein